MFACLLFAFHTHLVHSKMNELKWSNAGHRVLIAAADSVVTTFCWNIYWIFCIFLGYFFHLLENFWVILNAKVGNYVLNGWRINHTGAVPRSFELEVIAGVRDSLSLEFSRFGPPADSHCILRPSAVTNPFIVAASQLAFEHPVRVRICCIFKLNHTNISIKVIINLKTTFIASGIFHAAFLTIRVLF